MLINHAKLIHFFQLTGGVTGRKKLQKMIYILRAPSKPLIASW